LVDDYVVHLEHHLKQITSYWNKKDAKYNSLIDKEKAIISDGLSSEAPLIGGLLQPIISFKD
jgi:hypothetical protein